MNINIKNFNTSNIILIDTREPYEYKIEHIPDSINVPYDLLELAPERYLSKKGIYYLYCQKGIKSIKLSENLNQKGYKTHSINGGFEEYLKLYKSN